jgi:glycosyltransferase involved in cell wall biosynthesis
MDVLPVSVIIPTYNRAELIARAIRSVINQLSSCDELIVVDDGSTDNTIALVQKLCVTARFELTLLTQENRGPAAARNAGIKVARNETLAFLDSDDHWHKNKLKIQYARLMESSDILISHTMEKWLRRGKHLNQKKKHIPRDGYIFDHCLELCAVGMSTVMVQKELFRQVGYFDESLRCCEDYDLWLRVSSRFLFLLIDTPLTVKEGGREDQLSCEYRQGMDELRIRSIEKLLTNGDLGGKESRLAARELLRKLSIFGNGCIKHGRVALGNQYLRRIPYYQQFIKKRNFT